MNELLIAAIEEKKKEVDELKMRRAVMVEGVRVGGRLVLGNSFGSERRMSGKGGKEGREDEGWCG